MPLSAFGDGSLFGSRTGSGPARVLALHGWGRSHRDFDEAIDGLNAISLDLPGFGATPPPARPGGAEMYAELIESVLTDCQLPIVVVGHSFGGRVAVHLACRRPGAIAGLVLTGAPLLHPTDRQGRPALRYRVGRRLHQMGLLPDHRLEGLRDRYGSADYRAAEGVMRGVLVTTVNESYERQLGSIAAPVELLWGELDDAAPAEIATRAEALMVNARLTVLEGVGHFTPTEAAHELRRAIDRLLGGAT